MSESTTSRRRPLTGGESTLPAGMRSTRATRALLALLRSQAAQRLSAADAEAALARLGVAVNRVTVFRALDRLAQAGLLQRQVDNDRVTRYQWRTEGVAGQRSTVVTAIAYGEEGCMAYFRCLHCQQRVAVDAAAPAVRRALQGLARSLQGLGQLQQTELQGLCRACLPASTASAA